MSPPTQRYIFVEASHWPSDHMISSSSRPLIGKPPPPPHADVALHRPLNLFALLFVTVPSV